MSATNKIAITGVLRPWSGIEDIDVELELHPPWDPSRMSEAAKLQLGMM